MDFFWPFVLYSISMAMTPGANNTLLMTSGLNHGTKKSLPLFFGVVIGFPTMIFFVGVGAGQIFSQYLALSEVIKIVGVLYLLYLAWITACAQSSSDNKKKSPLKFWQAVLIQWINPKAWMVASVTVVAYINPRGDILAQMIVVTMVSVVIAVMSAGTWLLGGVLLQRIFQNLWQVRLFNIGMAILLLVSIAPVILEILHQYSIL